MLLAIVLLFALCWSPTLVDNVLIEFGVVDRYHHGYSYHHGYLRYARQAFALMSYANSCVNPVVYAFMSRNFRAGFYHQKASMIIPLFPKFLSKCVSVVENNLIFKNGKIFAPGFARRSAATARRFLRRVRMRGWEVHRACVRWPSRRPVRGTAAPNCPCLFIEECRQQGELPQIQPAVRPTNELGENHTRTTPTCWRHLSNHRNTATSDSDH